jgi:hypothetical protein
MFRTCLIGLTLSAFAAPAGAYYISWEGDCLPEEAGWTRSWGDWSGHYHGTGAVRTIADGVMTMDSLYDEGIADLAEMYRPFNPAPGELLVMEWRLAVDQVVGGYPGDPGIALFSDDWWRISFQWDEDSLFSLADPELHVAVAPGEFHDYRITSSDMRTYDLFVDGQSLHQGSFRYGGGTSTLAWGDGTQGVASLHRWDYVRIYTIPEPTCLALCGAGFLLLALRRHIS